MEDWTPSHLQDSKNPSSNSIHLFCISAVTNITQALDLLLNHINNDDKLTLVQVMAWCYQALSHYLNQCWPRYWHTIWHHLCHNELTHWGRVMHICVGKLIITGSDNGLSPDQRKAIISANAGLLSIGPLRTYFSENSIKIQQFSLKKMHMKMSSVTWCPSCLGLNVLNIICDICSLTQFLWRYEYDEWIC